MTLRHRAFQLAVHYWEGKWILETEKAWKKDPEHYRKTGKQATIERWQRHAMLTPCFVSTFFMAPKFFTCCKYSGQDEQGKKLYDTIPLYSLADLLIVNEAGQVTPEVGAATFALAKQAMVVGDVKQIEPVWSTTHKIDKGNLKKARIIRQYHDQKIEEVYSPKGFLSSDGSIMKMAQNASAYQEKGLHERGVLLVEHRRCYDEIIHYCNELAYNGQLKALKGNAPDTNIFPPMCLIHVEGRSEVKNKERSNRTEAEAIVNWLTANRKKIELGYKKSKLEDVIGIITPFVGQKKLIFQYLRKAEFDVNRIKMGTVHALQGAECPVILFSMAYGADQSGSMFFDREDKPNMLNVAVSRAKDSFVVFANRGIFNNGTDTPSGLLGTYLEEVLE
ncbi:MAG: AAA domain-containing protein [Bacteroides sp.]|nr:AAA domain-containing protein [Bacteroides sp.]